MAVEERDRYYCDDETNSDTKGERIDEQSSKLVGINDTPPFIKK